MKSATSPISTFSIVGRCPRTNMLGVGVASKYLAVGAVCSHTEAGVGAIATQAYGNPYLGIDGLALLSQGMGAQETLERLLDKDPGHEKRQVIIINRQGETAVFSGALTTPWTGHGQGDNCAVAGNILAGPEVIRSMVEAFEESLQEELAERLLRALEAGQQAGGDRRGKQAAHLQVVHQEAWKYVDLRVDEHAEPIVELRRIFEIAKTALFPFRKLYPTRSKPGIDWDLGEYERLSAALHGRRYQ